MPVGINYPLADTLVMPHPSVKKALADNSAVSVRVTERLNSMGAGLTACLTWPRAF